MYPLASLISNYAVAALRLREMVHQAILRLAVRLIPLLKIALRSSLSGAHGVQTKGLQY